VRDNHGNSCVRQANIYPIIDTTNGEVLGSYALSMLVNPLQILDSLRQSAQTSSEHHDPQSLVPNLKLTIREHEVLFLLLYNFSQEEIAKILQVTRSTIQKVISTRLCEKFNLPTSNSKELIAKAHALKLYNYFPPSLLGKHLIELSKDKSIITALRRSLKGY
jgi:DNA-binding CsgD family transcriptional regulator